MKKCTILDIKLGIIDDGAGMDDATYITSIKYMDETNKSKWLSVCEFDGMPLFYLSDKDIYDNLIVETEESYDAIEDYIIEELEGIELVDDYEELLDSLEDAEPITRMLIVLSILLTVNDVPNEFIDQAIGKSIDQIDLDLLLANE